MVKRDELEVQMRSLEWFHRERVPPGLWLVIRLDGRAFGRFTATRFEKPFDNRLRDMMVRTAEAILADFQGFYAYTMSDEISVLLAPEWNLFARVVEKIVSVSAGLASAAFTKACGEAAHFDSRVWLGVNEALVRDYFRWRQADANRNALSSWCYWTLRKAGARADEAALQLRGRTVDFKYALLSHHGIDINAIPIWQRRGIGLYWRNYEKQGYDPIARRPVMANRRRIAIDLELPMGEAYVELLQRVMQKRERVKP